MSQQKQSGTILINTSNYDGKNSYVYKLPTPVLFKDAKIAVESLAIYNSTYNISSSLKNNTVTIKWLGTDYNIVIPDGYYDFDALNDLIAHECLINKLYCTADSGNKFVFFFNLSANSVTYKADLEVFTIPTSAQATSLGFTIASGASWSFPVSATTPQLVISAGLQTLFGFKTQSIFPTTPQSTNQSFSSDPTSYPVLSPVFTYIFTCNLVNTKFSNVGDMFYQLPIKNAFGGLIDVNQRSSFVDISDGSYNQIVISLYDQNFTPLEIHDPELSLTLSIQY